MWASQLGKTECVNNIVGFFIDQEPAPILVVQPSVEFAEAWSKERLDPMLRDTPRLNGRVSEARSRNANNTIRMKSFPGGNIAIVGANAPSGLAGRPRRVVLLDEVDRFGISAGDEGDPCSLAIKRTASFWNSVVVMTSTPTIKGKSRIEAEFEASDKRKWYCPCPDCGTYQELKWMQLKWDKKTFEGRTIEHYPETAYYECEKCGSKWDDTKRVQAVKSGEWRATAKFSGKRGYHLNGIACTFPPQSGYKTRLHQMASEFLDAKRGGPETLKSWTNTFLAETFEDTGERIESTQFMERREDYTPQSLPVQVLILICAVDVQGDRIEYEIIGLGDDEETWGVEFGKIIGDPERAQLWKDLKQHLEKKFQRVDGIELLITCTAIDIRHKTKRVTEFIKTCGLPRVYGVYGASHATKQVYLVTPHHNKYYHTWNYSVNTTLAKDMIFARLKIVEPGPRYMHWHTGYGQDYFDGLTAEEKKTRFVHGFPDTFYGKIRPRNEPLDLRVYFLAAVDRLKPNMESIRKSLTKPAEQKTYDLKTPEVKPSEPPKPQRRKRLSMKVAGLPRY